MRIPLDEPRGSWYLQVVESARTLVEAEEMLAAQAEQEGYVGGRALPAGGGKPARMQAFFDDDGTMKGSWLPDGVRRVFVPAGMGRALGIGRTR